MAGSLPIKAHSHKRQLFLFGMISRLPSVLYLPDAMTACMLANSLPIIDHLFLDILLERYFAGRILEKVKRVWKVIKETPLAYLVEPGLGGQ